MNQRFRQAFRTGRSERDKEFANDAEHRYQMIKAKFQANFPIKHFDLFCLLLQQGEGRVDKVSIR
jgi:hypothetical protein